MILKSNLFILVLFTSCSSPATKFSTVPDVDISRYAGTWYEIARLPNTFEKGLICVMAEYKLCDDGKITVINSGRNENDPSVTKSIKGIAWVPDQKEPGRLKVRFFWPFSSGYYIFHLDKENYQYSLVGTPSRKFFWILSRSPFMEDELVDELLAVARDWGFDTNRVIRVQQDCD